MIIHDAYNILKNSKQSPIFSDIKVSANLKKEIQINMIHTLQKLLSTFFKIWTMIVFFWSYFALETQYFAKKNAHVKGLLFQVMKWWQIIFS